MSLWMPVIYRNTAHWFGILWNATLESCNRFILRPNLCVVNSRIAVWHIKIWMDAMTERSLLKSPEDLPYVFSDNATLWITNPTNKYLYLPCLCGLVSFQLSVRGDTQSRTNGRQARCGYQLETGMNHINTLIDFVFLDELDEGIIS